MKGKERMVHAARRAVVVRRTSRSQNKPAGAPPTFPDTLSRFSTSLVGLGLSSLSIITTTHSICVSLRPFSVVFPPPHALAGFAALLPLLLGHGFLLLSLTPTAALYLLIYRVDNGLFLTE